MNPNIKHLRILLLLMLVLGTLEMKAYDLMVDGICYNYVSSSELSGYIVTSQNSFDEGSNYTRGYAKIQGSIVIPETVNGRSVIGIDAKAFKNCSEIYSVTIPMSIVFIGEGAFYNCKGLSAVSLPNGLMRIESLAFNGCSRLKSIVIPKTVEYIGGLILGSCERLSSIIVEEGNKNYASANSNVIIDKRYGVLIQGCNNSKIPGNGILDFLGNNYAKIKAVGRLAFAGCTGLKSIRIPGNIKTIEESAFYGCTNLTSVKISKGVEYIQGNAFGGCSSLKSIKFPNSIKSLSNCIGGCISLEKIELPKSLKELSPHFFTGIFKLKSIKIPESVEIVCGQGELFEDCISLETIKVPKGTKDYYMNAISPKLHSKIKEYKTYNTFVNGWNKFWNQLDKGLKSISKSSRERHHYIR